jgi:hypothetical protein
MVVSIEVIADGKPCVQASSEPDGIYLFGKLADTAHLECRHSSITIHSSRDANRFTRLVIPAHGARRACPSKKSSIAPPHSASTG